MNWHFSLALVAEFSALDCLDSESCALLKSTRIAEKSCYGDRKKGTLNPSQSGTTCEPSTVGRGVGGWMSLLPDSRVSHSVQQENSGAKTTSATCGLKPSELFATWDQNTCSWKTPPNSRRGNTSGKFLSKFNRSGIACNGALYRRRNGERRTCEIASGLWPTPNTPGGGRSVRKDAEWRGKSAYNPVTGQKIQVGLEAAVRASGSVGPLNPPWIEWLMGWPIGWTDIAPLATAKFQQWLEQHGGTFDDV